MESHSQESTPEEYILRRLLYVRRLYIHGVEHAKIETQLDLALAILNFDNAIEMLFYTVLEHIDQPMKKEQRFDDLLTLIKEQLRIKRISETVLHEKEVRNLHYSRNNVQHHGIVPSAEDVKRFQVLTESVLINLFETVFGINTEDLSLGILIKKSEREQKVFHISSKSAPRYAFLVTILQTLIKVCSIPSPLGWKIKKLEI